MARRFTEIKAKANQVRTEVNIDGEFTKLLDERKNAVFIRPWQRNYNVVDSRSANERRDSVKIAHHGPAPDNDIGGRIQEKRCYRDEVGTQFKYPLGQLGDVALSAHDNHVS
jgi:hypothetical protein